jgi:hypothetical protein
MPGIERYKPSAVLANRSAQYRQVLEIGAACKRSQFSRFRIGDYLQALVRQQNVSPGRMPYFSRRSAGKVNVPRCLT